MFNHPFFYKKKLFKLLDLYGALIRDGKTKTFQSAILMVRRQGEEPKALKLIIEVLERGLIAGDCLCDVMKFSLTFFQESSLEQYRNETEFIRLTKADTSNYPSFDGAVQECGDESSVGEDVEIFDSKLCQLSVKILQRAKQEKAEAAVIELKGYTAFFEDQYSHRILMVINGEKIQTFDLPGSLVQPITNLFLGLAELPYWTKGNKSGRFQLSAAGETFAGEVDLKEDQELWIKLDSSTI